MARELKVEIGALNIVMEKHKSKSYIDMLNELCKMENEIIVRGDTRAEISGSEIVDSPSLSGVIGRVFGGIIYKFSELSASTEWHNKSTAKTAEPEDLESLKIPPHLKPHEKQFSFIFFEKGHKLVYQAYSKGSRISAKQVVDIFGRFFAKPEIVNNYGAVNVTHMPDEKDLALALKSYSSIRRINLNILRPNPDHTGDLDDDFLNRMVELNISQFDQSYIANKSESITVDDELKRTVEFASENGTAEIAGSDSQGRPARYKSKNSPRVETHYFDPDDETRENFFVKAARALYNTFL